MTQLNQFKRRISVRSFAKIVIVGAIFAYGGANANENTVAPGVDSARINQLLRYKFPPVYSNIQCHGTAMAVTDVLSILMPLNVSSSVFSGTCFREVDHPRPGDYGMFTTPADSSFQEVYHTFTVVNEHQIFQKANPGWTENPFELITVASLDQAPSIFKQFNRERFIWTRYTPSPNCLLTQTQMWIDAHRHDPVFGPFIVDQEGYLAGRLPKSTAQNYFAILRAVDAMTPYGMTVERNTIPEVILHALHEYLIRTEFAQFREPFIKEYRARYTEVLSALTAAINTVMPGTDLGKVMALSRITYNFNNIAIFDNSRTGYFKVPEPVPVPEASQLKTFDVNEFNRSQSQFKLEAKTQDYEFNFLVHVKNDPRVWSYTFSR